MSKRKLVLAGLTLAAVVVVLAALLQPRETEQTWTLPDGSNLRLLKITSGTHHRYRYGNRVLDFLYPLVPARFRTNFNFRLATISSAPQDTLVLWMEHSWGSLTNSIRTSPALATQVVTMSGPLAISGTTSTVQLWQLAPEPFSFTVMDEFGVETQPVRALNAAGLGPATYLVALVLPDFPRRERTLRLSLYSSPNRLATALGLMSVVQVRTTVPPGVTVAPLSFVSSSSPGATNSATFSAADSENEGTSLARIVVPNPAFRQSPIWSPETMPARRHSNEVEITLVNLETGCPAPSGNARDYSRATFAVRENGRPTRDWIATRLVLGSASGKVIALSNIVDHGLVQFPASLWLSEPAWKVEAGFLRIGSFLPDDLWTLRDIPVPENGRTFGLNTVTTIHGRRIRLASITSDPASAEIRVDLVTPPDVWLTLVEAEDNQGRTVASSGWRWDPLPARGGFASQAHIAQPNRRLVFFPLATDAKTLNMTLGVRKTLNVEFCVKPALAETIAKPVR